MFDSRKELLDRIRLGEATFLELKEVRFAGDKIRGPRRDELADELAAFSNGRGGVCLLGVADSPREITGIPVERLDAVVVYVREICTDSIEPPISPVIEPLWLPATTGEDLAVIKVDVARSLFVHRSPGGFVHRVGDAKRTMAADYLARLFQQRSQVGIVRFDEQTVPGAELDDLSSELWERFRTPRTDDARDGLLSKLRLARTDENGVTETYRCGCPLGDGGSTAVAVERVHSGRCLSRRSDPLGRIRRSVPTRRRRFRWAA